MKTTVRKREWFDDESFWRELYLCMFPDERIAVADEQIEKVLALTKPTGNSVLDAEGVKLCPCKKRVFCDWS